MAKLFLRSGSMDKMFAVGENGQPVFASALQIREGLRLTRNQSIADCLAIPQPNDAGDRIDWYSPVEGKVTSWASATPEERASALRQLESCQALAVKIGQRTLNAEKTARRLFGALLTQAIRFPDQHYVYLVGGKPVITFWGFASPQQQVSDDALACLRVPPPEPPATLMLADKPPAATPPPPRIDPVITPSALDLAPEPLEPPEASPAAPPPVKSTARRWRRLIWLASILLVMILAIQLRNWITGGTPAALATPQPAQETPRAPDRAPAVPAAPIAADVGMLHGGHTPATALAPAPSLAPPTAPAAAPAPLITAPAAVTEPQAINAAGGVLPAPNIAPAPAAPASPVAKNALSLSADAVKIGSTDFLDGIWRVMPDIKEPLTGRPPSLKYQLKQGRGTVRLVHGDGITCRADASAGLMRSGNLVINSRAKARCSDGSRYQMPEIICKQGANGIAECKGRYDADTAIPLTFKREKE